MPEPKYVEYGMGAIFSEDMKYRYNLWRSWDNSKPTVIFIMLNPSTADDKVLDPTVRRCLGYAMQWGFGSMEILNLFALRSTDPKALYSHPDPVGKKNDKEIHDACNWSWTIIAAWGIHGKFMGRGETVAEIVTRRHKPLYCLQLTKGGIPSHPLYLKGDLKPVLYREAKHDVLSEVW
jgi:hypothetical protein